MQRKIIIQNKALQFTVRKSRRAKYLRLTVNKGGEVIATMPCCYGEKALINFINREANWLLRKIEEARAQTQSLLEIGERTDYLENKTKAGKLVQERINHFNQYYNLNYKKIFIKNQKCRWGSCSSAGNLNFNWRIIYLPQKFADYLVVHELCHLREMNHSKCFWNLVGHAIPDYRKIRKRIQKI